MVLISLFPFAFRWWVYFSPLKSIHSSLMSRSDFWSDIGMLLVEVLVVSGVFLLGALAIILLLGVTGLFLDWPWSLKPRWSICPFFFPCTASSPWSLGVLQLRPERVFPASWFWPDAGNLTQYFAVQVVLLLGLLTVLPALAAMALILLMLVPLIHVMFWPLLWKPLHKLGDKLFDIPGLFISGGMACIGVAWPGSPLLKVLEHIHEWL